MSNSYMPTEVKVKFNTLLSEELKAERHYLSCAIWCQNNGYDIAAKFFYAESESEKEHAQKLINYFTDLSDSPTLPFIAEGTTTFTNLLDVINVSLLSFEKPLYDLYGKVYSEIEEEYPQCAKFLLDFIQIQHDSIAEYSNMIDILNGVNPSDKFAMLMLQEQLFKM